jgi:hypothetical protein
MHLSYVENRFPEHQLVLWHLEWVFSVAMELLDLGITELFLLQVKTVLATSC